MTENYLCQKDDSDIIPLDVLGKEICQENGIILLCQSHSRFPIARFKCILCRYYFNDYNGVQRHIRKSDHIGLLRTCQNKEDNDISCIDFLPSAVNAKKSAMNGVEKEDNDDLKVIFCNVSERYLWTKHHIVPLSKKPKLYPQAMIKCNICEYYFDKFSDVEPHMNSAKHLHNFSIFCKNEKGEDRYNIKQIRNNRDFESCSPKERKYAEMAYHCVTEPNKYFWRKHHMIPMIVKPNLPALFKCPFCIFYGFNENDLMMHIQCDTHLKHLKYWHEKNTIKNLPPPTPLQLQNIDQLLAEQVEKHGLSCEDLMARQKIRRKLNIILQEIIPGSQVIMYGSTYTGYGLKTSDLNLSLKIPCNINQIVAMKKAYALIKKSPHYRDAAVQFMPKPSLLFTEVKFKVHCLLTFAKPDALKLSELFAAYADISETGRKLVVILRLWGKECELDDPYHGTFPAYAFPLLVIYFLQQLEMPVLPVLYDSGLTTSIESDEKINPKKFMYKRGFKWKSMNTMSLGELWLKMFRFYIVEFQKVKQNVNINQLKPMFREKSPEPLTAPKMTILDPCKTGRNVGKCLLDIEVSHYFYRCMYNTYKYYGVIQSLKGPIFTHIVEELRSSLDGCDVVLNQNDRFVILPRAYEMTETFQDTMSYSFNAKIFTHNTFNKK